MDIMRLLSSAVVQRVLALLSISPSNPRNLANMLGIPEQTIAHRLRELEEAGLVEGRWSRVDGKNVKMYKLKVSSITIEFSNGEVRYRLGGSLVGKLSDFNVAPMPPSHFIGREEELKRLEACSRCIVYGMPGIGKTALAAKYVENRDHAWFYASPMLDVEAVSATCKSKEVAVIDRAEFLDYSTINSLAKIPSDKVVVLSRVYPRGVKGFSPLKLGRLKELADGFGHPGIAFGGMTPKQVVEEAKLSPMEYKVSMLMATLGVGVRWEWMRNNIKGGGYALSLLRRKGLVSKVRGLYVLDPVVKHGIEIDAILVDSALRKLQDIDELACPLIKYYASVYSYEKVRNILSKWLEQENVKLFFEDAHKLVNILSGVPKSDIVSAALAKAYASLFDFASAKKELVNSGRYRSYIEKYIEYMEQASPQMIELLCGAAPPGKENAIRDALDKCRTPAEKALATYAVANWYLNRDDAEVAEDVLLKAYEIAYSLGYRRLTALILSSLALARELRGKTMDALLASSKALDFAKDAGMRYHILPIHALILFNLDKTLEAKSLLEEALEFYEKTANRHRTALTLLLLSDVMTYLGAFEEALQISQKAHYISQEINSEKLLAGALVRLAEHHSHKQNFKHAIKIVKDASSLCKSRCYKRELALAYNSAAIAYGLMRDDLKSFIYFKKAEKIAEALGDWKLLGYITLSQAKVSMKTGEVEKAQLLATKALKIYKKTNRRELADMIIREFQLTR